MVQKAVAARPNSGAMQDSLGWAHYRLGQYSEAVELLESAIQLDPSDPAINDHLGDAYWMIGRKDEATFQWNRVLTLSPDAALKKAVDGKLKTGLGQQAKVAIQ
jgi:Flp pilus assembly protein TadD